MHACDMFKYATALKIPHFRGVFMRNQLPVKGHLCLKFLCGQLHTKDKYCLYKKV